VAAQMHLQQRGQQTNKICNVHTRWRCSVKGFSVRTVPFKNTCYGLSRSCKSGVETGECISVPCAVQEASRYGGGLVFLWLKLWKKAGTRALWPPWGRL